jgi:hypothetical protein
MEKKKKEEGEENHNCTLSCLCDETEMMLKRSFFVASQFLSTLIFHSNCQIKVDALHKLDHVGLT